MLTLVELSCTSIRMNLDIELPEIQLRAARLMAMGMPNTEIAKDLVVDRTTLYRWRN